MPVLELDAEELDPVAADAELSAPPLPGESGSPLVHASPESAR